MAKRIFLWGTSGNKDELIADLEKIGIQVLVLFQGCSEAIPSMSILDILSKISDNNEPTPKTNKETPYLEPIERKRIRENYERLSLFPFVKKINTFDFTPVATHYFDDWLDLCVEYYSQLLIEHKPDEIWFMRPPHLAVDDVLNLLARRIGLNVMTCMQSLFPGRFFYFKDPVEVTHPSLKAQFEASSLGQEGLHPNLFYMKPSARRKQIKAFLKLTMQSGLQNSIQSLVKFAVTTFSRKNLTPLIFALEALGRDTSDTSRIRHKQRRLYNQCRKKKGPTFNHRLNTPPYIYFPLHLQPEATTSYFGAGWVNQAEALETLYLTLPPGWILVVKENPAQNYFYRSELFYARLRRINSLYWAPDTTRSDKLIAGASIVATITGTAGYEALLAGKPCVYFGDAWYGSFPGTFRFDPSLDLSEIASTRVDKSLLCEAVNLKVSSLGEGVLSNAYLKLISPDNYFSLRKKTATSLVESSDALFNTFSTKKRPRLGKH